MSTFASNLVLFGAIYNYCGAASFLIPGILPLLNITPPECMVWAVMPAYMACTLAAGLIFTSRDIVKYGSFAYWGGIVRSVFFLTVLAFRFDQEAGIMMGAIALGDLIIGLLTIFTLPGATGRSHYSLLIDEPSLIAKQVYTSAKASNASNLVLFGAIYNYCGAASFLVPGVLPLLNIIPPGCMVWAVMPAYMACTLAFGLIFTSRDIVKYGSFAYWGGIVRSVFFLTVLAFRFDQEAGIMMGAIALGDLIIGMYTILTLPAATGRSHYSLLIDEPSLKVTKKLE